MALTPRTRSPPQRQRAPRAGPGPGPVAPLRPRTFPQLSREQPAPRAASQRACVAAGRPQRCPVRRPPPPGEGGGGAERSAGARSSAAMEPGVEELMPRLLPVDDCDLAEDFDPTVPPRTPQEYLKRVQ